MKLDVELISEMMILERRLVQVGSGARTVGKRLGRRDEGFDALWSRFGVAGDGLGGV